MSVGNTTQGCALSHQMCMLGTTMLGSSSVPALTPRELIL